MCLYMKENLRGFELVRGRTVEKKNVAKIVDLLAETFQILGDSSRLHIVCAIADEEQNVGDIAKKLKMSQPAVSHHLRMLRNLKLVSLRKEGRTTYYRLDDRHIHRLIAEGVEHVEEFL